MEAVGYITTTIVLVFLCGKAISLFVSYFADKTPLPKAFGAAIPETDLELDISKPYDIVYNGGNFGGEFADRIEGIRIVGYVGRDEPESFSKLFIRGRWLVVEYPDKRRAFVMPHSIVSLKESAPIPFEAPPNKQET